MGGVKKLSLIFIIMVTLAYAVGAGCTFRQDFDSHLSSIIAPYRFNAIKWESRALLDEAKKTVFNRKDGISAEADRVTDYFASIERLRAIKPTIEALSTGDKQGDRASLENELNQIKQNIVEVAEVEEIIQQQIRQTLYDQGIFNPLYKLFGLRAGFPPMKFKLEEPLYLLVISPRSGIERLKEITLKQDISLVEIEKIEDEVDALGVSSLIVQLGGFAGTYPAFVTNQADLRFTVDAAIEEWVHQYLVFKSLGFRYLLDAVGISKNAEIVIMNETLAGMVSREVGAILYGEYYENYQAARPQSHAASDGFDFNHEMRDIRKQVDVLLARGDIEQAEAYMKKQQQYLADKGYYIRKLNQAYFAFFGTYTDTPASVSPIGQEMAKLRQRSSSLSDFLEKAAGMTSRQDLIDSIR